MSSLKSLAQKAKFRLRAIIEEGEDYSEACLSARGQYAIIASQKKVEDDPIYSKVKRILAKDIDTVAPLAQLIDNRSFDALDISKREKYLFGLSRRYTNLKDHLEKAEPIEAV